MLPQEVFDWIDSNINSGSRILEFGSGNGSKILSKKYELISIEHDETWLNMGDGKYIHAEIRENRYSTQFSQRGWYDVEKIVGLPSDVELIIIDGPWRDRSGRYSLCAKRFTVYEVDTCR